jgi:hypothetical protein
MTERPSAPHTPSTNCSTFGNGGKLKSSSRRRLKPDQVTPPNANGERKPLPPLVPQRQSGSIGRAPIELSSPAERQDDADDMEALTYPID